MIQSKQLNYRKSTIHDPPKSRMPDIVSRATVVASDARFRVRGRPSRSIAASSLWLTWGSRTLGQLAHSTF